MSLESLSIIDQISREKGIDKGILIDAVKSAVEAAARKKMPHIKVFHTQFNEETGEAEVFTEKTVVKKVANPDEEIGFEEALKSFPEILIDEKVLVPLALESYGRIAAQQAKQVILQKVREAEVDLVYKEFLEKKGLLINGMVSRFEHGDLVVDLGKTEGVLPRREQVFRESFNRGDRIRAYVLDVRKTARNASVILSRTHIGLIKNLFELEVPEINEGMVEIMGIVREPNGRTKIAVKTNDRDIDAVGACVGMRGMRVQSIVQELRGEKIDIVEYSEDPEVFIRNALSPAKVSRIIKSPDSKHMTIIVADDQMSLAIGKKGQNVRLAAKLVQWKIDIQGESQAKELGSPSLGGSSQAYSGADFLETIRDSKGLGEKITAILFSNNVVNFKMVTELGIEGLTALQGIGPKKAEAILAVTEAHLADQAEALKPAPVEAPQVEDDATASEAPVVEEEDDEPEIPVDELVGIDGQFIALLHANGFETLAELSITSAEELLEIDGMDEETAKQIIEQARQRMENAENN